MVEPHPGHECGYNAGTRMPTRDLQLLRHPEESVGTGCYLAVSWVDNRLTLLWFLERDPRARWDALTGLEAPFVSTLPGTGLCVDQLR